MNMRANTIGEERPESLVAVLRREPERSLFVVKLGLAGLLVIVLWAAAAPLALPVVAVVPVLVALLAVYGATMIVLTANLVRSLDHWQVTSAMHTRRLLATASAPSRQAELREEDEPVFYDWYFSLRLEEEVKRHRREGGPMAVVVMRVAPHDSDPSRIEREQIDLAMAHLAVNHQDVLKFPNSLETLEYAFCLPGMDSFTARDMVSRLVTALGNYWCYYGVAVYPEDASTGEALLEHARTLCAGSTTQTVA